MVNITLSIPEELKKEMDKFPEINWSEIARGAIKTRLIMLLKFKKFVRESKISKEDALILGKKVNKEVAQKYKR
jgi:hypothetical protein